MIPRNWRNSLDSPLPIDRSFDLLTILLIFFICFLLLESIELCASLYLSHLLIMNQINLNRHQFKTAAFGVWLLIKEPYKAYDIFKANNFQRSLPKTAWKVDTNKVNDATRLRVA